MTAVIHKMFLTTAKDDELAVEGNELVRRLIRCRRDWLERGGNANVRL